MDIIKIASDIICVISSSVLLMLKQNLMIDFLVWRSFAKYGQKKRNSRGPLQY